MHLHVFICIYTNINIYIYICIHIYICSYIYMYIFMSIYEDGSIFIHYMIRNIYPYISKYTIYTINSETPAHSTSVVSIRESPLGNRLLSIGEDGSIFIFNLSRLTDTTIDDGEGEDRMVNKYAYIYTYIYNL
jgi:WD40 repeat protein